MYLPQFGYSSEDAEQIIKGIQIASAIMDAIENEFADADIKSAKKRKLN